MRKTRLVAIANLLFIVWALCPARLQAQGLYGTIRGVVTDKSGAVIPGIPVRVTNVATNVATRLTTNSAGEYNASSLNPGVYSVQASAKGFKTALRTDIRLEVNATAEADLVLQVGQTTETVVVASEAATIQTEQPNLGQTVDEKLLDELPLFSSSGRNVFSLIPLSAGVSQQIGVGAGTNNNLRINGDRPRDQDYMLDGITITDPFFGGQSLSPSPESIQEFEVVTNSLSAQYGDSGGGLVFAVTRSGTSSFHGSAYEYYRGDSLDSRNYFEQSTTPKNPYRYNEFGGSIGGPIKKGKLFFFTDYQGIRSSGSSAVSGVTVPDANFRSGDLSELCPGGFDGSGNCLNASGRFYYPGTQNTVPYDKIATINPISTNILAVYPTSTVSAGPGADSLTEHSPYSVPLNRFNPRVDYNISARDRLFGAYHYEGGPSTYYDIVIGPAGEQRNTFHDYVATIGWTHTLNSNTLNDFRFGNMNTTNDRAAYGQGNDSPSTFGINGIPNCLSSVPNSNSGSKCGTPGVNINGFSGLSGGAVQDESDSALQITEVFSRLQGRHSINVGVDLRHYIIDNYQPKLDTGNFGFNGTQTGNPFADFLFGNLANGSNVNEEVVVSSARAWATSAFVQDDFKLTHRLTINLGIRYQWQNSFHEIHDGNAYFDPFTVQWIQFGVNAPSDTYDPWNKEFGPRAGFEWSPLNGVVVRGGYGIMFPGTLGHGKTGDGNPGPNLLANTVFQAGTNWSNLPPIANPSPSAIKDPIGIDTNGNLSFSVWAPRKITPTYNQLWNLTVEKQLGLNTIAQLSYAGDHGTHLPINYGYNICQQTPQSTAQFGFNATTSPYCPAAGTATLAAGGSLYDLVVNPGWWGLSSSVYHALTAKVDHRFSHSFSLLANFTWSKLIDDSSSDWSGFWGLDVLGQDFYDRRADRSVSAGDIPVRFTIAPIVELPFGPGKRWAQRGIGSYVIGGWRASAIYTISDGAPFGILDNSYGYCNAAHTLSDRPDLVGNMLPQGFHQSIHEWFNIDALDFSGTCPVAGLVDLTGPYDTNKAFGNAPRYYHTVRVPGANNLDFSIQKEFRLPMSEAARIRVQMDAFNFPNHPQFAGPGSDPTGANFGAITATSTNNRTIQLGAHFSF